MVWEGGVVGGWGPLGSRGCTLLLLGLVNMRGASALVGKRLGKEVCGPFGCARDLSEMCLWFSSSVTGEDEIRSVRVG